MLLSKIKPGLFASVTLPWTHLFLSQFTHLCGMCFCFLKKQLLYHPQLQALLVDSSKPSRCSLGNNPTLVQTDFGAKTLFSPWPWKSWECFLLPPQPRRFSSPTGTAPGTQGTWNLGSSQPAANSSGMCQVQLLESLGKPLLLGIDISGRLTDTTSKTFHFESSFHSLFLENTN